MVCVSHGEINLAYDNHRTAILQFPHEWLRYEYCELRDTIHLSELFIISVPKYDLEFMIIIAHYVKFISKVTQGIFMFLAVITSDALLKKCTNCTHDCEASLRKALSSYLHMQLVVIMWVATRFQYHYAFCLLIDTILESLHQLIFFSNLIWKGKIGLRHK